MRDESVIGGAHRIGVVFGENPGFGGASVAKIVVLNEVSDTPANAIRYPAMRVACRRHRNQHSSYQFVAFTVIGQREQFGSGHQFLGGGHAGTPL